MSKEKQIEEMALELCHPRNIVKTIHHRTCDNCDTSSCDIYELCVDLYNAGYRKLSEAVADALKKQIPQKPDYEGDGYDDSGNLIYDTWICPNCGDRYELDYEIHQYCPMCGQHIDWNKGE